MRPFPSLLHLLAIPPQIHSPPNCQHLRLLGSHLPVHLVDNQQILEPGEWFHPIAVIFLVVVLVVFVVEGSVEGNRAGVENSFYCLLKLFFFEGSCLGGLSVIFIPHPGQLVWNIGYILVNIANNFWVSERNSIRNQAVLDLDGLRKQDEELRSLAGTDYSRKKTKHNNWFRAFRELWVYQILMIGAQIFALFHQTRHLLDAFVDLTELLPHRQVLQGGPGLLEPKLEIGEERFFEDPAMFD